MNVRELLNSVVERMSDTRTHVLRLQGGRQPRKLRLTELEDRVLFSASPATALVDPSLQVDQSAGMLDSAEPVSADPDIAADSTTSAQDSQQQATRELVFVDSSAEDYQQLLDDLWSHQDPDRQLDVVLLSTQRDGIEQITETLAQYTTEKLDAVHFVSHGTENAIKLGSGWLTSESIQQDQALIESWSHALNEGADLLFYGCDLAGSDAGRTLLENIATATGADIAASIDDTGAAVLGGDWDLEYELGNVTTDIVFSEVAQADYSGLLNTFTVTNTNDSGAGSLRQAIINANSLSGTDTISFAGLGAGTHTITLASSVTVTDTIVIDGS
ncbi:MAG: DUF4347 domain-containing protein, partial [Planctomycetaceae bacterium]|nr:DUF4347 domain-containing protein [Planctomycetaceae bacterium]